MQQTFSEMHHVSAVSNFPAHRKPLSSNLLSNTPAIASKLLLFQSACNHTEWQRVQFQALEAAQQAIRKFEAANTPWQRPPDYYAELVKSDDHMAKVKQQLMHEQEQMEVVEQR